MPLMTVNNHGNRGKDHRSQPRWSAGKKTDRGAAAAGGESLEELSRELKVEAHRLAAWRDDLLAAGKQGLKGQRADRKIDQLTMETRCCGRPPKKGGSRSRRRSGPGSHAALVARQS
jgi:hypothetical protein